jgi:ADP-heptose:LPS heptosyltransferase
MSGHRPIPPEWRAARRILAVRLDNLGDVLLMTPAIHAIRESLPDAGITLLASEVGAQAGRLNPDLADVIIYQSPQMDPWARLPQDSAREQRMIALIKERRFDGAIIFTSFRQSALPAAYLCYLADIPLRLAASIDGSGSLLTTHHRHPEHMMHEVERALDLVGAVGLTTSQLDLVLEVPYAARAEMRDWRLEIVKDRSLISDLPSPLVVVHPGCSMPARTYPWELFAEVVGLLVEQLRATVALTGAAHERELIERIYGRLPRAARRRVLPLAGALPFEGFCALIEAADLTITNNTGPMHVAAAVKTPVAALFALTNPPEQWRPWRAPHRLLYHNVPCRICYSRVCPYEHECLHLVTPAMVIDAAADLLAGGEAQELASGAQPAQSRSMLSLTAGQLPGARPTRHPSSSAIPSALGQSWELGAENLEAEEFGWRLGAGWRLGGKP